MGPVSRVCVTQNRANIVNDMPHVVDGFSDMDPFKSRIPAADLPLGRYFTSLSI